MFVLACAASYGFTQVFSGRAAFVHIGAFLGTIMAANVFFIIIPNQKKVVAALIAGQSPDPALGKRAKQRSLHNNYLTLPVVLMMISNHYPMMFEHEHSWLIVAGILLFSGLVRLYANLKNAGASGSPVTAILLYAAMVGMARSAMPATGRMPISRRSDRLPSPTCRRSWRIAARRAIPQRRPTPHTGFRRRGSRSTAPTRSSAWRRRSSAWWC